MKEMEEPDMKNPRLNSNDGTNLVMDILDESKNKLKRALEIIIENNSNGKQFDYCNVPELSDEVDTLQETINEISKVVYQK